jgi:hypothetical protein
LNLLANPDALTVPDVLTELSLTINGLHPKVAQEPTFIPPLYQTASTLGKATPNNVSALRVIPFAAPEVAVSTLDEGLCFLQAVSRQWARNPKHRKRAELPKAIMRAASPL